METVIHSKIKSFVEWQIVRCTLTYIYIHFYSYLFFQSHNSNFKNVKNKIYELINFRSKILSGTLPVDELKEVQRLATSTIDIGNK